MTRNVRYFDFPRGGEPWEYMKVVEAALDDEGLRLAHEQGSRPQVILVRDPGLGDIERVVIPTRRITRKES